MKKKIKNKKITLKELKVHYEFYSKVTISQIEKAKYYEGFSYKVENLEEVLAENEAILRLIKEKEKRACY